MSSQLTRECLTFDERPSTPPHVKKYRRSTYLEPGRRFQHHGLTDDISKMQLDNKVYGITENPGRDNAADLMRPTPLTDLQRMNLMKQERTYKNANREPLGRSPERGTKLPAKFIEDQQPFGVKSKSALEPAKNLIFPVDAKLDSDEAAIDLYKRSHGSYAPGEQKRRGYDWSVDPTTTRFGRKGDTIAFNGVSKNIADVLSASTNASHSSSVVNLKKVEDYRNMGDLLGKTKNLGQDSGSRPIDMVYGKPSGNKGLTAAEVLKGRYSGPALQPDRDLGKSITPGFRNISLQDRSYGCPSIRSDIPHPPPGRRSLADSQNYGDDVPAQDLINPPAFSDMSIGPLSMGEPRPKAKILDLFQRIGFKVSPEVAEEIFYVASEGEEYTSINSYRDALNEYIIRHGLVQRN